MDKKYTCNPETCQYHALTESVITDLKDAVKKLTEGQEQMNKTVVQLTEAFKWMDRIDRRVEKVEDLQRAKDREQDHEIGEVKGFMYRAGGVAVGASVALPYLLKMIGLH